MTKLKSLIAALGCAALTACSAPPSNPNAGPGLAPATAAQAASLFQRVCVANRGNLNNMPATLATLPFTRNSENDLYFHNQLDLSFALLAQGSGATCSLVYSSSDSFAANQRAIGSVAPDARISPPNENNLYGVRLSGRF